MLYPPEYPCKNSSSRQGAYRYDPIISFPIPLYTCPSTPAKTGALGRGLLRTILSSHFLFLFTCPSTPAKTGAPGRGLIRTILSYPILFLFEYPCKNWGSRQGAYTYDPIISFPIPLYLLEYPRKNWGSKQGAYTNDPIISYPILLYLPEYPCKNWGPRQGVCTFELILNVPDKIAVVPSTHTSRKLPLRRATLHY